jgi:uncharacterized protein YbcI
MNTPSFTITEQVAHVVRDFQQQRTGHAPKSVSVVLGGGTLVITLHEALTPAELALSRTAEGAAQVRDFHHELFQSSLAPLRGEIERITGIAVREAAAEIEPATGAVIHVFTTGTMVQVFELAGGLSGESWSEGEHQSG